MMAMGRVCAPLSVPRVVAHYYKYKGRQKRMSTFYFFSRAGQSVLQIKRPPIFTSKIGGLLLDLYYPITNLPHLNNRTHLIS